MPLEPSPAVGRAAELLQHLARQPLHRWSVSELARELGMPRATCDTVLRALGEQGFVRRDGELRYTLGPACIVVGDAARSANAALRAAAPHAEALARSLSAFSAVTIRDRQETRVTDVFDFGPALGFRARVGEAIQLVPPFGASFVAWDDADAIGAWLARADPPLSDEEVRRYRAALDTVRRRGYSVTLMTARQPTLIDALERLREGDAVARRERDEAVRHIAHSEYLPAEIDADATMRIAQISSPVFEPDGSVGASIMLLGPAHDVTVADIADLGRWVRDAADQATANLRGH
jgi:DNA-binding IclR family transcriptional regulator